MNARIYLVSLVAALPMLGYAQSGDIFYVRDTARFITVDEYAPGENGIEVFSTDDDFLRETADPQVDETESIALSFDEFEEILASARSQGRAGVIDFEQPFFGDPLVQNFKVFVGSLYNKIFTEIADATDPDITGFLWSFLSFTRAEIQYRDPYATRFWEDMLGLPEGGLESAYGLTYYSDVTPSSDALLADMIAFARTRDVWYLYGIKQFTQFQAGSGLGYYPEDEPIFAGYQVQNRTDPSEADQFLPGISSFEDIPEDILNPPGEVITGFGNFSDTDVFNSIEAIYGLENENVLRIERGKRYFFEDGLATRENGSVPEGEPAIYWSASTNGDHFLEASANLGRSGGRTPVSGSAYLTGSTVFEFVFDRRDRVKVLGWTNLSYNNFQYWQGNNPPENPNNLMNEITFSAIDDDRSDTDLPDGVARSELVVDEDGNLVKPLQFKRTFTETTAQTSGGHDMFFAVRAPAGFAITGWLSRAKGVNYRAFTTFDDIAFVVEDSPPFISNATTLYGSVGAGFYHRIQFQRNPTTISGVKDSDGVADPSQPLNNEFSRIGLGYDPDTGLISSIEGVPLVAGIYPVNVVMTRDADPNDQDDSDQTSEQTITIIIDDVDDEGNPQADKAPAFDSNSELADLEQTAILRTPFTARDFRAFPADETDAQQRVTYFTLLEKLEGPGAGEAVTLESIGLSFSGGILSGQVENAEAVGLYRIRVFATNRFGGATIDVELEVVPPVPAPNFDGDQVTDLFFFDDTLLRVVIYQGSLVFDDGPSDPSTGKTGEYLTGVDGSVRRDGPDPAMAEIFRELPAAFDDDGNVTDASTRAGVIVLPDDALQNGNLTFEPEAEFTVADVDADTNADIVVWEPGKQWISFFISRIHPDTGELYFVRPRFGPTNSFPRYFSVGNQIVAGSVFVGDVSSDGRADVVLKRAKDNLYYAYIPEVRNQQWGADIRYIPGFEDKIPDLLGSMSGAPPVFNFGDGVDRELLLTGFFNEDVNMDMLFRRSDSLDDVLDPRLERDPTRSQTLYEIVDVSNATGANEIVRDTEVFTLDEDLVPLFAQDTNGDGLQDIIFRNTDTGEYSVWLMEGVSVPRIAPIYQESFSIDPVNPPLQGIFSGTSLANVLYPVEQPPEDFFPGSAYEGSFSFPLKLNTSLSLGGFSGSSVSSITIPGLPASVEAGDTLQLTNLPLATPPGFNDSSEIASVAGNTVNLVDPVYDFFGVPVTVQISGALATTTLTLTGLPPEVGPGYTVFVPSPPSSVPDGFNDEAEIASVAGDEVTLATPLYTFPGNTVNVEIYPPISEVATTFEPSGEYSLRITDGELNGEWVVITQWVQQYELTDPSKPYGPSNPLLFGSSTLTLSDSLNSNGSLTSYEIYQLFTEGVDPASLEFSIPEEGTIQVPIAASEGFVLVRPGPSSRTDLIGFGDFNADGSTDAIGVDVQADDTVEENTAYILQGRIRSDFQPVPRLNIDGRTPVRDFQRVPETGLLDTKSRPLRLFRLPGVLPDYGKPNAFDMLRMGVVEITPSGSGDLPFNVTVDEKLIPDLGLNWPNGCDSCPSGLGEPITNDMTAIFSGPYDPDGDYPGNPPASSSSFRLALVSLPEANGGVRRDENGDPVLLPGDDTETVPLVIQNMVAAPGTVPTPDPVLGDEYVPAVYQSGDPLVDDLGNPLYLRDNYEVGEELVARDLTPVYVLRHADPSTPEVAVQGELEFLTGNLQTAEQDVANPGNDIVAPDYVRATDANGNPLIQFDGVPFTIVQAVVGQGNPIFGSGGDPEFEPAVYSSSVPLYDDTFGRNYSGNFYRREGPLFPGNYTVSADGSRLTAAAVSLQPAAAYFVELTSGPNAGERRRIDMDLGADLSLVEPLPAASWGTTVAAAIWPLDVPAYTGAATISSNGLTVTTPGYSLPGTGSIASLFTVVVSDDGGEQEVGRINGGSGNELLIRPDDAFDTTGSVQIKIYLTSSIPEAETFGQPLFVPGSQVNAAGEFKADNVIPVYIRSYLEGEELQFTADGSPLFVDDLNDEIFAEETEEEAPEPPNATFYFVQPIERTERVTVDFVRNDAYVIYEQLRDGDGNLVFRYDDAWLYMEPVADLSRPKESIEHPGQPLTLWERGEHRDHHPDGMVLYRGEALSDFRVREASSSFHATGERYVTVESAAVGVGGYAPGFPDYDDALVDGRDGAPVAAGALELDLPIPDPGTTQYFWEPANPDTPSDPASTYDPASSIGDLRYGLKGRRGFLFYIDLEGDALLDGTDFIYKPIPDPEAEVLLEAGNAPFDMDYVQLRNFLGGTYDPAFAVDGVDGDGQTTYTTDPGSSNEAPGYNVADFVNVIYSDPTPATPQVGPAPMFFMDVNVDKKFDIVYQVQSDAAPAIAGQALQPGDLLIFAMDGTSVLTRFLIQNLEPTYRSISPLAAAEIPGFDESGPESLPGFSQWALEATGNPLIDPELDPDGDGMNFWGDYTFAGTGGEVGIEVETNVSNTSGDPVNAVYLTFVRVIDTSITWRAEITSDWVNWTVVPYHVVGREVLTTTTERVTVRIDAPEDTERFFVKMTPLLED